MTTNMDYLASQARHVFADSYTLVIRQDANQLFMDDIDNVTREQALSVFERNKGLMIEHEPTGTTIELIGSDGFYTSYTS